MHKEVTTKKEDVGDADVEEEPKHGAEIAFILCSTKRSKTGSEVALLAS